MSVALSVADKFHVYCHSSQRRCSSHRYQCARRLSSFISILTRARTNELPFAITKVSFSIYSTTTQQTSQNSSSLSPHHDTAWLDGLNSPLIQDEGDNKMLKLRFDVSQYTPEEIVVKTVDNKLLVSEPFLRLKLLNLEFSS